MASNIEERNLDSLNGRESFEWSVVLEKDQCSRCQSNGKSRRNGVNTKKPALGRSLKNYCNFDQFNPGLISISNF